MRSRFTRGLLTIAAVVALLATSLVVNGPADRPAQASSHREAPLIIADPTADNTDVYAFRSYESGREGFVTLIANFIPFQEPSGGPHFYLFDPTVLYEIKIDNTGDGVEDITYQFQFRTRFVNGDSVLGMASPNETLATGDVSRLNPLITSLTDPDYNEPQTYSVRRRTGPTNGMVGGTVLASNLITPPSNIGVRTTPNYEEVLARPAIYNLTGGGRVFAGQRDEGFYFDVGGLFDTINYRSGGISDTGGVDGLAGFNVNTIAIEVPIQSLTRSGAVPTGPTASDAVIGVWATAGRQTTRVIRPPVSRGRGITLNAGPFRQVSRLANPLVNELIVPLRLKDTFNATTPAGDAVLAPFILDPQLPRLIQAAFAAIGVTINIPPPPRNDLVAIFATGIPAGAVPGAPTFTTFLSDGQPHEMMRLNVAIPPSGSPSRLGLLGNDLAGYPNGRRVFDDVAAISQRTAVGGTPFTPAFNVFPNNRLSDGVSNNDVPYLTRFPYLGVPHTGNDPARGMPHDHHTINIQPPLP
ncbi:MAG: DUF4331 domain-containing protein [Pyrinomonadaceae bacterium]